MRLFRSSISRPPPVSGTVAWRRFSVMLMVLMLLPMLMFSVMLTLFRGW